MNKHFVIVSIGLLTLGGTLICVADENSLAAVSYSPTELSFQPYSTDTAFTLRVSCDNGGDFAELFPAGENPWYMHIDEDSNSLPDGGVGG